MSEQPGATEAQLDIAFGLFDWVDAAPGRTAGEVYEDRLRLLGEVEPGLPYSTAQCAAREILILTKAGGFGTPQTLLHCREFLRAITAVEAR